MINGLRSEFYKLFHTRIFWILLLFCLLFSIFVVGLLFLEEKGVLIEQITIEVDEEGADAPLQGFNVLIESVRAPDSFFIYLFSVVLGAFFIAGEYSNGTIKNIISSGQKRYEIYLTKAFVSWIGTISVFVFMIVGFALLTSLFFGFGPLPSSEEWLETLRHFGLICLLIGGFVAITTFISIHSSSSAIALFSAIGFYLIFVSAIGMLANKYTLFEHIQHYSVFKYMAELPLDVSSTSKFTLSLIGVSLSTIIVFACGGMALFQKKDIS